MWIISNVLLKLLACYVKSLLYVLLPADENYESSRHSEHIDKFSKNPPLSCENVCPKIEIHSFFCDRLKNTLN